LLLERSISYQLSASPALSEGAMLTCKTTVSVVLVASLLTLLITNGADAQGAQTNDDRARNGAVMRSSRQIVTSPTFSPAVAEFLQRPLGSQLVTLNPNGSPQVTIMWFKYENGALLFTTTIDRIKFRNQQKNSRAAIAIMDPANMYKWVIVSGKLSVDNRDPAVFYRGLAEHYLDETGLAEWRKTAVMEKRTVLKLIPTQIRTMGFPP
jgi:PPOX class probable F420-dependent enzyme